MPRGPVRTAILDAYKAYTLSKIGRFTTLFLEFAKGRHTCRAVGTVIPDDLKAGICVSTASRNRGDFNTATFPLYSSTEEIIKETDWFPKL